MLIREGNQIRFKSSINETEDKKLDNNDIQSLLKSVTNNIKKKMSSEIDSSDFENVEESYIYSREGVVDWAKSAFTKKGKIEKWLNDIVIQIQGLFENTSFSKTPITSQGGWCFPFGVIDEDGRFEVSTITPIDNYMKVIKKIPSLIEITNSSMMENTSVLKKVKDNIRKHVSSGDTFLPFFCITKITKKENDFEHDCFGFTLGVISTQEIMKGVSGIKEGSKNGKNIYRYEISSVYISADNIVNYELEIPKYLEKLLQLRSKKKINYPHRSKIRKGGSFSSKNRVRNVVKDISDNGDIDEAPNPRGSKEDKFFDLVKEIEGKGVKNYTVTQLENILVPYIFDEDYEDLYKKLGGDKSAGEKMSILGDYSVSTKSPEIYLALLKSIKDLSYKDLDSLLSSVKKDSGKRSQDDIKTAVSSPSKKSPKETPTMVSQDKEKSKGNGKTVVSSM